MFLGRLTRVLGISAGIAAASVIGAGAAIAGPPYTVAADGASSGPFQASGGASVNLKDLQSGITVLHCASSTTLSGALGSYASGSALAQLSTLTFSSCLGPGGMLGWIVSSVDSGNPAYLNVSGTTSPAGATPATVSNLRVAVTLQLPGGTICSFLVSGSPTVGTAPATVSATYLNGSGSTLSQLGVSSGATAASAQLWINNVTNGGCLGIQDGDPAQLIGNYPINMTTPANGNPLTIDG